MMMKNQPGDFFRLSCVSQEKLATFTGKSVSIILIAGNMIEFQVMHHFKALEMLISLIYWTCNVKVVCSRNSAINYFIKARVVFS